MRPSDLPPPWSPSEAVAAPRESDPIEVGVLIVGAGPAGLAAAIRLAQLTADEPELATRLGDVPVAVLEQGKTPGAHLLSGAVIDPGPLSRLLGDVEFPSYGEVRSESVLYLTSDRAWRLPTPPTMRNRGKKIVSLAKLGRFLAERAEELGATIIPETVGQQLLVENGVVVGVRTGDRGRGRDGAELRRFEAGGEIRARVTILAEGTQGHLTLTALEAFDLAGPNPQTWALGVKEVWRVAAPLDRVIHTMGWPLRPESRFREFGGAFIYPLGNDMVTVGMVVGLDYRDAGVSVHDLLQQLKTHPSIRPIFAGGERIAWGAKTIPEGGFAALPKAFHAPGLLLCGDGVGLVNVPALKGVHYAVESGRLAAEAAWAATTTGEVARLADYDASLRTSFLWRDLRRVRNVRQGFARGFRRGVITAGVATLTRGLLPPGTSPTDADASHEIFTTTRAASYPAPDGLLTFDKLSSVFLSGNRTRDDQPNHIRLATRVPLELGTLWARMCPSHVYELQPADDGLVTVDIVASNCVQCGAITAKGGRLTPPEGDSGPEYTIT
ncbi:MAG: electron-transfer flavoprotein:ubiquinone oxidoreductase [Actinomycetes bacterium]